MKNFVMSAMALAAFLVVPNVASADEAAARTDAIRLCRAEIVQQTGLTADDVRLDNVRVRLSNIRVDLDVFRNGQLENVRCDVSRTRGEGLTVASITPALQTASLAR